MAYNSRSIRFRNSIMRRLKKSAPQQVIYPFGQVQHSNLQGEHEKQPSLKINHNIQKTNFITPFFFNSVPICRSKLGSIKRNHIVDEMLPFDSQKKHSQTLRQNQNQRRSKLETLYHKCSPSQQLVDLNIRAKSMSSRKQLKTQRNSKPVNSRKQLKTQKNRKHFNTISHSFYARDQRKTIDPVNALPKLEEQRQIKDAFIKSLHALPTLEMKRRKSSSLSPWQTVNSPLSLNRG